ncbi:hypothetical protein GCM10022228_07890 [Halomonas cibimaris]|uniref:diguanylate cyclase n=1 Tax=Halomonas cibimaris TaxID=657012 RepID=A0ABP7LFJ7_9GAMM
MNHPNRPASPSACLPFTTADVLRATPLGACVTDADGFFEFVNPAYCEFYGYTQEELVGQHFTLVVPKASHSTMRHLHDDFIAGDDRGELHQEWEVRRKDGQLRTIIAEATRMIGDDGRPRKMTFIIDISVRKRLEERLRQANEHLEHMARHDPLTGLLNRRAGLARLEEEVTRCRRYASSLSVAMCDLDAFKAINDTHGHATGDAVLEALSQLIRDDMRRTDIAVRLGGEEFLLIMPGVTPASAEQAVDRLRRLIAETPVTPQRLTVTISVGLAGFDGETPERLLEHADRAMYRAKRDGRNRVVKAAD